jgi:hypothetical protein
MKYLITTLFLLIAFLMSCATSHDHLKIKYPFARLTPDYGILDETDLWISEQEGAPKPISEESPNYPYWQCYLTSAIHFSCEDLKTRDAGIAMGEIRIQVQISPVQYESYEGRRGIPMNACSEFVAKWKKLTHDERYTCIAGLQPREETQIQNKKVVKIRSWTYDRLKTKKGCVSYFDDYCLADYWRSLPK